MKRWLVYGLLITGAALFGGKTGGTDIAKLQPVQTVWLAAENGRLQLCTETGETGQGQNVAAAVADLDAAASAEIFWDTVDYLIFPEGTEPHLEDMAEYLRPSCRLCVCAEQPDLAAATEFLERHAGNATVRTWLAGEKELPELKISNGRMELVS